MKILVVIVLYKIKLRDAIPLQNLRQQLFQYNDRIGFYIYDNSPVWDEECLHRVELYGSPFEYVSNTSNPGLSKAYNEACQYAENHSYDWLLLLDQDTTISDDAILKYLNEIDNGKEYNMFVPKVKVEGRGYMSPCIFKHKRGRFMNDFPSGKIETKNITVINSGLLIRVDSFKECGGYDNDVYLDFSDHDFFYRFKKLNPYIYVIDTEFQQDFTCLSTNMDTLKRRFTILCECVRAIKGKSLCDKINCFFVVLLRALHLTWITKSFSFIKILISKYIFCQ